MKKVQNTRQERAHERSGETELERAYAAQSEARRALSAADLVRENFDAGTAVVTVLETVDRLRPMLGELASASKLTAKELDALRAHALATYHAIGRFESAVVAAPRAKVDALEEARVLRTKLARSAKAFAVVTGELGAEALPRSRRTRNRTDIAAELAAWREVYQAHWEKMFGRTAVTAEDLARIGALRTALLDEARAESDATRVARDELRRAVTLLARGYAKVRREVLYARADALDGEALAPSFYVRRRRARPSGTPTPSAPAVAPSVAIS